MNVVCGQLSGLPAAGSLPVLELHRNRGRNRRTALHSLLGLLRYEVRVRYVVLRGRISERGDRRCSGYRADLLKRGLVCNQAGERCEGTDGSPDVVLADLSEPRSSPGQYDGLVAIHGSQPCS